jgi:thiol:disulfide interchange protein DsbD
MNVFKSIPLLLIAFLFSIITNAQDSTTMSVSSGSLDVAPIAWTVGFEKLNDTQIKLSVKGDIPKTWHIYATDVAEELAGPVVFIDDSTISAEKLVISSKTANINDEVFENKQKLVYQDSLVFTQLVTCNGIFPAAIKILLKYEAASGNNFITDEQKIKIVINQSASAEKTFSILKPSIDINKPLSQCGVNQKPEEDTTSKSLMGIFFIGFLGGLIALLTPCVFPMIPLTVSFFTKKAHSKKEGVSNAFLYGFFIFLIYVLLSLPFHFLDSINPEFLNNISTNVYLNVVFFIVFVFFAFSFFGFYEITLPASISSGADSKAGVGNILGIFFMALTLALVSFSCTGPILGSLLAGSLATNGGAMQLTFGMGGFGLALALPFALFAMFPKWLQSMPKSGGWLNTVKVVLGFLELALAFKFLSNADLVKHWGILKREIFIGVWIIVGFLLSLYILGKLKFKHDNPNQNITKARKILGYFVLLFTLYLIPGVTNTKWANLKLISGFPPPLYYSVYEKKSDCIFNLRCTKNYTEGLEMAKAEKKPILLDFTGYACVNCRRTEENIWSDADVNKMMVDHFIVVSLYVDDKKVLPVSQQFTYKTKDGSNKEIVTYGDLWATFETENFANNAQPLYAIINTDEVLLNHPVGYTDSKTDYLEWLKCGLETFQKK